MSWLEWFFSVLLHRELRAWRGRGLVQRDGPPLQHAGHLCQAECLLVNTLTLMVRMDGERNIILCVAFNSELQPGEAVEDVWFRVEKIQLQKSDEWKIAQFCHQSRNVKSSSQEIFPAFCWVRLNSSSRSEQVLANNVCVSSHQYININDASN